MARIFEIISKISDIETITEITIGLTWPMKAAIYRAANERGVSELLHELIDEHPDLPAVT